MKTKNIQIILVTVLAILFCGLAYGGQCYCIETKGGILYDCKAIMDKYFCPHDNEDSRQLIKKNEIESIYADGDAPCNNCQRASSSGPRIFRGDNDEIIQN